MEEPPTARPARSAPPAQPIASGTTAEGMGPSIGQIVLGLLFVIGMMIIFRFELVPVLILGAVLVSMFGTMRSAAKASGRRTSTMPGPDGRTKR